MIRDQHANKVVKPSSTQHRASRISRPLGALVAAAHAGSALVARPGLADVDIDPRVQAVFHDAHTGNHQYAVAAAAAQAAVQQQQQQQQQHVDHREDPEADADADMDDDDGVASAMAQHADHMDLNTAASILANGTGAQLADQCGIPQHQHVHHHAAVAPSQQQAAGPQAHGMDPQLMRTTEQLAAESGYGNLNVESALAKRLAREPGLRLAQQRRSDQQLNLNRRSNVEALFAHVAGTLAPQPCKNCHKGHGPWSSCVVVDGQMCGSCANCWFNASGARCSFHDARNQQGMQQPHPHAAMTPTPSTIPVPDSAGHYGVPQPMLQPAAPTPSGPAAMAAALSFGGPVSPIVQYTINNALSSVRNADRKTRQLMMIEVAAKQLAFHIAEYEENNAADDVSVGGPSGQQGLGDDGSN